MFLEHELEAFTNYCADAWNWFRGLPCSITRAKYNRKAKQYNVLGNSKQEIEGFNYNLYTPVEYLQSSGEQYIDTGYTPVQNDEFEFKNVICTPASGDYQSIFSAGTGDYQLILLIVNNSASTIQAWYKYFAAGAATQIASTLDTVTNIKVNANGDLYYNDTLVGSSSYTGAVNTSLFLFIRANLMSISTDAQIGEVIVTNNNVIKLHLIPCYRNSDSKPGMFDTVTQTFFTNANTSASTDFTCGSTLPTPATPVEIESVGDNMYPIIYGYGYDTTGSLVADSNYWYEDEYIDVDGVSSITISGSYDSSTGYLLPRLIGYSSSKTFIDYWACWNRTIATAQLVSSKYIRISNRVGYENTLTITNTNTGEVLFPRYKIPVVNGANCGCVNLGDLTWTYNSIYGFITSGIQSLIKAPTAQASIVNAYCERGTITSWNNLFSGGTSSGYMACYTDGRFGVASTLTDATTFKNSLSGVYLYYQKATDSSWTAPTTTNIYLDNPLRGLNVTETPYALPSEYQQVEYIATTAKGPYIATNYIQKDIDFKLFYKYQKNTDLSTSTMSCENRAGSSTPQETHGIIYRNSLYLGNGSIYNINTQVLDTDYTVELTVDSSATNKVVCKINDTTYSWTSLNNWSGATYPDYIFTVNDRNTARTGLCVIGRFYYVRYETLSGKVMLNLIPAKRISDSVVGMYDTVTGTFYTNAGTGSFTAGPEIYSDYLDYKNQNVVRNVEELILTGSEDWALHSTLSSWFYLLTTLSTTTLNTSGYCTNYKLFSGSAGSLPDGYYQVDGAQGRIVIKDTRFSTAAEFKTWLAAQYNAGTPVVINYQRSTSTTTSATIPAITTQTGTNIITVPTEVTPANFEIQANTFN